MHSYAIWPCFDSQSKKHVMSWRYWRIKLTTWPGILPFNLTLTKNPTIQIIIIYHQYIPLNVRPEFTTHKEHFRRWDSNFSNSTHLLQAFNEHQFLPFFIFFFIKISKIKSLVLYHKQVFWFFKSCIE